MLDEEVTGRIEVFKDDPRLRFATSFTIPAPKTS